MNSLGDFYYETKNVSAKRTLRDICIRNINRLVFGHLNIKLRRTKFDFLCKQIKLSIDVFMISESNSMTAFHMINF